MYNVDSLKYPGQVLIYHFLPPISGEIIHEEVTTIFVEVSGVLETSYQRLDSPAVSDGSH